MPAFCAEDFTGSTRAAVIALGHKLGIENPRAVLDKAQAVPLTLQGSNVSVVLHLGPLESDQYVRREVKEDVYRILSRRPRNPNGALIDIGSNYGLVAMLYAKLNPAATVYAFEPAPMTFFYMAWNVVFNRLGGTIRLRNTGLSNRTGFTQFEYAPDAGGTSKSVEMGATWGSKQKTVLRARMLDLTRLLDECVKEPVSSVKLDCEGCEFNVVPANADFFASSAHRVFGEFHARHTLLLKPGSIPVSSVRSTWKILCSRPKVANDCIEWLSCDTRGPTPWLASPYARGATARDVRVCK